MGQPPPARNDREEIQAIVISELRERLEHGRKTYGTGLQVGNGRRMSQDALEEIQDLLVYMTGIREQDSEIIAVCRHLLDLHRTSLGNGGMCQTCVQPSPCHTAIDVACILKILGAPVELPSLPVSVAATNHSACDAA